MSRKRHNVDRQATEVAHFADTGGRRGACRSYITKDGKEFRFGEDKEILRGLCLLRDNFTCTSCDTPRDPWDLDMHHIKPLGKGGDDKLSNVTTRCKWGECHKGEHVRPKWGPQNDVRPGIPAPAAPVGNGE